MKTIFDFVWKQKLKLFIGLIVVFMAIFLANSFGLVKIFSQEKAYKTKQSFIGNLIFTINASGQVEANDYIPLTFLVTGKVAKVNFQEGDLVKKGEVIAQLDAQEYAEAVSKAEASYRSAQSALNKVIDDTHLWQYGNSNTTGETQTQKTAREQAEATRDGAYRDLQVARKQLTKTSLIAPFDGKIAEITGIKEGQNITATTANLISVINPTSLIFMANVDEIDFSKLDIGQIGEIILDSYPEDKFVGQIVRIHDVAVKQSTGGSIVPVEVTFSGGKKVMHGLNGEVNFNVILKENVLIIPRSAVKNEGENQYVYVLVNNKPQKKNVTTGETSGAQVEISSGLVEGEELILGDVKP